MHKLVIIDDSKCKEALDQFLEENQENVLMVISGEEFNQRIENIMGNLTSIYKMHRKIICRREEGFCRIPVSEIIYIESDKRRCLVHDEKGRNESILESLENLEEKLKELGFYRLSQNILINLDFMDQYIPGPESFVILNDNSHLTVDKDREEDFCRYLDNWK